MGVRAEEVDIAVLQEAHGLAPCFEGQEELGITLHQNAEVQEFVPDGDGLVEEIALDMGHQDLDTPLPGQLADLLGAVSRPGFKGHLEQEKLRPLQAELRELVHAADAREIEDLGAEEDAGGVLREDFLQSVPGLLPAEEKAVNAALGRIEMRGGTDGVGPLLLQGVQHQEAGCGILAAVVDARENMTVKIDHSVFSVFSSAASTGKLSSAVASRKACRLDSVFLDLVGAAVA